MERIAMVAGQRILVVEDSYLLEEALCDFVADRGLQPVGPAGSLETALACAGEAALDGALLDINLDGCLCFQVCDLLDRRGIPFCFVTGYSHLALIPER